MFDAIKTYAGVAIEGDLSKTNEEVFNSIAVSTQL